MEPCGSRRWRPRPRASWTGGSRRPTAQRRDDVPTYRAPGVFIEEVSSGSRPITPVGTSTAAFIGTARKGPVNVATLVTSFAQFDQTFGGPYRVTASDRHYLAYAVRHFFEQGGSRCYVVRVAHYTDPNIANTL